MAREIGDVRDHRAGGPTKSWIESRLVIKATGLRVPAIAMQATAEVLLRRIGRVPQAKFADDIGGDNLADLLSGNTRDDAAKNEVCELP
jgi:hypothetical protein